MSGILNIGMSGLLATRSALELTSENISNVDTARYHRRALVTQEVLPSGGVQITDVRRAFDELLAARLREAGSGSGASDVFQTHARGLESLLLPGPGGITDTLDSLFDAFDAVAQSPADPGLRLALLGAGDTLAAQVNDLDTALSRQAAGIEAERAQAVSEVNTLLDGMAKIEEELSNAINIGARNPLLDLREATLDELSNLLPIHVRVDDIGRATVRLGGDDNGPILIERGNASRVDLAAEGRVRVLPPDLEDSIASLRPASSVLGGLAEAADLVAAAQADVDAWASKIATDINAIHKVGVTEDGEQGGAMFLTSGWRAEPGALMRGNAVADFVVTNEDLMPPGPLTLVYDAAATLWRAEDASGAVLAEGADGLSLPGVSISLNGPALNGDRIELKRGDGEAGFFRMALTDPDAIAAGGALIVSAGPRNNGDAELLVAVRPEASGANTATQLTNLADAFAGGDAVEFVSSGVVGVIPAGTETAILSAQPRYAATDFAIPSGATTTALSLTRAGSTFEFTAAAPQGGASFVAALNDGSLAAASGETLANLGLVA